MTYARKINNKLSILSFNILAESWFSNHLYDLEIVSDLNKYFPIHKRNKSSARIKKVKSYLDTLIKTNSYDVICLQETEDFFNEYLIHTYSDEYQIFAVYHNDSFWLKDINPNIPFYPNGLTTMIKKKKFKTIHQIDIKLDIGNHGILTRCIDNSNYHFNIINAHLDVEDELNINEYLNYNRLGRGRYTELYNIKKILSKKEFDIENVFNFVIGDLNDGLNGYATHTFLTKNKFVDLFKITDNLLNTYPYISKDDVKYDEDYKYDEYDKDDKDYKPKPHPYSILDKIFLLTENNFVCHKTTIHNKYNKIVENLLKTGSDHYAIDAVISY